MLAFKEVARILRPSPDASLKLFCRSYKALIFISFFVQDAWNNSLIIDISQLNLITQYRNPKSNNADEA